MGLLDTIKSAFNFGNKQSEVGGIDFDLNKKVFEHLERIHGVPVSEISDYDTYLKAGAGKIWATWRACDIVSNVVATTSFNVVDKKGKPQDSDPIVNKIFTHPNTNNTFEELLYLTSFHIKLTGNAYWFKDSERLDKGTTNIFPLLPQFVKPVPDRKLGISKYEYQLSSGTREFKRDQIIHFKRPNPLDPVVGMGDIEAAEPLFQDYLNQGNVKSKSLERGNLPAGILVRKEFDGDASEWERMRQVWESRYIGNRGKGGIAWLTGDWDFLRLGLTQQESEQSETEKKSESDIFTHHGVPLSVIGKEHAANYATARQDYINFRRFTCLPLVKSIFARLNDPDEFLKQMHPDWSIHYELDGLIDVESRVRDYLPLVIHGAMTLNELREKAGLEKSPDPKLDDYYCEQTRITLDAASLADSPLKGPMSDLVDEMDEIKVPKPKEEPKDEEVVDDEQTEAEGDDKEVVAAAPVYIIENVSEALSVIKEQKMILDESFLFAAKKIKAGKITESILSQMINYFSSGEKLISTSASKKYVEGKSDSPTTMQVKWMLLGGDIGDNKKRAFQWASRQKSILEECKHNANLAETKKKRKNMYDNYPESAVVSATQATKFHAVKKTSVVENKACLLSDLDKSLWKISSRIARNLPISEDSLEKIALCYSALGADLIEVSNESTYQDSDEKIIIDALGGVKMFAFALRNTNYRTHGEKSVSDVKFELAYNNDLKAEEITDFPNTGNDRTISLRNSKYKVFPDYNYVLDLKENYRKLWQKAGTGGNPPTSFTGNDAFRNWGKYREGDRSEAVLSWVKRRERFIRRHKEDFLINGCIAMMKWGGVLDKGVPHMKKVVGEAKKKIDERRGKGLSDDIDLSDL